MGTHLFTRAEPHFDAELFALVDMLDIKVQVLEIPLQRASGPHHFDDSAFNSHFDPIRDGDKAAAQQGLHRLAGALAQCPGPGADLASRHVALTEGDTMQP